MNKTSPSKAKHVLIAAQCIDHSFRLAGIPSRRFYTELLRDGPIEAIVERIKYYIDTMARDGRANIFLNQIPAETSPGHIHAAVAACHTYGRFPIPENLDDIEFEIPERESFSEFLHRKGERIDR